MPSRDEFSRNHHRLTNIDEELRKADCSICGRIEIDEGMTTRKGRRTWRCRMAKYISMRPYIKFRKSSCERCGFIPVKMTQLDAHHINGNHSNNEENNIQTLCARCHKIVEVDRCCSRKYRKFDETGRKRKGWHQLSEIDENSKTANCSVCGRISIMKAYTKKDGSIQYRCYERSAISSRPYDRFKKDFCEDCGFVPAHPSQMDLHHIDYNHKNNEESNIRTLCRNCHRLYPSGRKRGNGPGIVKSYDPSKKKYDPVARREEYLRNKTKIQARYKRKQELRKNMKKIFKGNIEILSIPIGDSQAVPYIPSC